MSLHSSVRLRRGGAWGISLIGVALVGAAAAYGVALKTTAEGLFYPLADFLLVVALASTVAYSGYWLGQSDIANPQLWKIAISVGLGIILMATLMAWQLLAQLRMGGTIQAPMGALVLTQAVGAVVGLLFGVYHVQAVRTARRARRAERAASEAREANQQLEFLNHLLRHHLLNGVQVIQSYATLLSDSVDEDGRSHLDVIERRSDRLALLVDNIQVLVRSLADDEPLEPRSLADAVQSEVEVVERTYEGATVNVSGVDDAPQVRADELLPAVFENLLRNAIEHNTATEPRVEVRVERTDRRAVVRIDDNGPGVSRGIEEKFLEDASVANPVAEEGTGLYISNRLVERYDGDIHLEESDGDGARFVVELPLASMPADERERVAA